MWQPISSHEICQTSVLLSPLPSQVPVHDHARHQVPPPEKVELVTGKNGICGRWLREQTPACEILIMKDLADPVVHIHGPPKDVDAVRKNVEYLLEPTAVVVARECVEHIVELIDVHDWPLPGPMETLCDDQKEEGTLCYYGTPSQRADTQAEVRMAVLVVRVVPWIWP